MQKTNDLEQFKLMNDNRPLDHAHIRKLKESIKACNMLEFRPIIVSEEMYVIDGQHRLAVAKMLNLPIYFEVRKNSKVDDIIHLNVAKGWTMENYANYYRQNGYKEYIKLQEFATKYGLDHKVAFFILCNGLKESREDFKAGKFVFKGEKVSADMDVVRDCIECVRKNTASAKLSYDSRKLWTAMYRIVSDPKFNYDQFVRNVEWLSDRIKLKATQQETYEHFVSIFNYKSSNRIETEV